MVDTGSKLRVIPSAAYLQEHLRGYAPVADHVIVGLWRLRSDGDIQDLDAFKRVNAAILEKFP